MPVQYGWKGAGGVAQAQYTCGFCGNRVGPNQGYMATTSLGRPAFIFICPVCMKPTFVDEGGKQVPAPRRGQDIKGITDTGVQSLYDEARDCSAVGASTATVLLCRKILMNIAVQQTAPPGQPFVAYIDFLEQAGFIPPNGKIWVDQIRQKGNEATHEIPQVAQADATQILQFTEMLLRFVYEFPSMITPTP